MRTPNEREARNLAVLSELREAWAAADVSRVLATMAPDCVYEASVGPEPGTTFRGLAQVAEGVRHMLEEDAGCTSVVGPAVIDDDVAAWEWTYRWSDPGRPAIRGCDFFPFRDGLIIRKAGYRKCVGD